jgi:ubiquinone/menaquinone biosynthesis C-methylase UbiE
MARFGSVDELLEAGLGNLVLDVATGSGGFIGFLRRYARPDALVVAADMSRNGVSAAARAFEDGRVKGVQCDGGRLCFPDRTFDTVAVSNSVHHFASPVRVLREMARVLKPGGIFVIREMFRDGPQTGPQKTHILLHHWWGRVDRLRGVVHRRTLTRARLEALPRLLGLTGVVSEVQNDMETDPFNGENMKYIEKTIDSAIARSEGNPALQEQGRLLRGRLHRVGFAGASAVLLAGVREKSSESVTE